jgi:hypothetical protein
MPEMPEYMTELGYDAGRLDTKEIVSVANEAGKALGVDEVVRFFFRPYLYLDEEALASAELDVATVEEAIAEALTEMNGVALAVSTRVMSADVGGPLVRQVQHNHHANRSGNVYVAQDPYWFVLESGPIAVMRLVHPVDVAPTIAALLGMSPPAASTGTVLVEVTGDYNSPARTAH